MIDGWLMASEASGVGLQSGMLAAGPQRRCGTTNTGQGAWCTTSSVTEWPKSRWKKPGCSDPRIKPHEGSSRRFLGGQDSGRHIGAERARCFVDRHLPDGDSVVPLRFSLLFAHHRALEPAGILHRVLERRDHRHHRYLRSGPQELYGLAGRSQRTFGAVCGDDHLHGSLRSRRRGRRGV